MSSHVIKELTKRTNKNRITWKIRKTQSGVFIGYCTTLESEPLLISKLWQLLGSKYLVQLGYDKLTCGRLEGRKLYRAIEKSRTDLLVGKLI